MNIIFRFVIEWLLFYLLRNAFVGHTKSDKTIARPKLFKTDIQLSIPFCNFLKFNLATTSIKLPKMKNKCIHRHRKMVP